MAARANLVVGQSGGPTAVINNSLIGVVHQALQLEQIDGVYGMLHGIRGVLDQEFVDLRRESAQTLERLCATPGSALGTVRYKVSPEDYDRLLDVFVKYDIRYFLYIGGNDSMDTVYQISQVAKRRGFDLHAIGVPKTIDNDLAQTDHSPGFGSAARFVASAIRNSGYDTESMGPDGPIKLMEIMGRNAGWLTAAAALAQDSAYDPPHLIYLPERGVSPDRIASDVEAVYRKYSYCVVAVSEGIVDVDGTPYASAAGRTMVDAFGHEVKQGVVEAVAEIILDKLGIRARFDKPSYLQRSFVELASPVDQAEAYRAGQEGVRAAVGGASGQMVSFVREPGDEYAIRYELADLSQIANQEKVIPDAYINAEGNGVTRAFIEYARPLIGGPLPDLARLAKHPIAKR
jgi:6-phosphofructokinase 1